MTDDSRDERARAAEWLFGEFGRSLPAWLPSQRWFGGKSETIAHVRIEDVFWLSGAGTLTALVVLDVQYAASASASVVRRERAPLVVSLIEDDPQGCPVLGTPPWRSGLVAIEASTRGPALLALMNGLVSGEPVHGARGGTIVYADTTAVARQLVTATDNPPLDVLPVGFEQSNSSFRIGTTHVFKLLRRLDEGIHPALEFGRFLSGTRFRSAPQLEGSLTYQMPGREECALGILENWVENQGDGWSYALAQLEKETLHPQQQDGLGHALFELGTITADLHAALSSDSTSNAFAPEVVTDADLVAWRGRIVAQHERACGLLELRMAGWPESTQALARVVLDARKTIGTHVLAIEGSATDALVKIRVHGDYHLGQVLKTTQGFTIIDFEGEPLKSLAERRAKQCALKDVAGMLRSIDYAAATVRARVDASAAERISAGRLRQAFTEGYRSRAMSHNSRVVPHTAERFETWVQVFELEKALYEVEYEANNRPTWVPIPLRAAADILARMARR